MIIERGKEMFKITAEQQTAIINDFAAQAIEAPEIYSKAVGRTLINLGVSEAEANTIEKKLFSNIKKSK